MENTLKSLKEEIVIANKSAYPFGSERNDVLTWLSPSTDIFNPLSIRIDKNENILKPLSQQFLTSVNSKKNKTQEKTLLIKVINLPDNNYAGKKIMISTIDVSGIIEEEMNLKKTIKQLRKKAMLDSLTGLYNRNHLFKVLTKEIKRSQRYNVNLSLIMIDIDNFKSINDCHGHLFGDFIIQNIGCTLNKCLRDSDMVFRYAGDEFVILLPNTYYDGAVKCADKILREVSKRKFEKDGIKANVTVSMGICSYFTDRPSNSRQFIKFADQALAKVKRFGGNSHLGYRDIDTEKIANEQSNTNGKQFDSFEHLKYFQTITTLLKALELRDFYCKRHSVNVMKYAVQIAKEFDLCRADIERIRMASIVHDIGKIGISDSILLKRGKLTVEERNTIKKHPQLGLSMLRHLSELKDVKPIILYHHEWFNGEGYPEGLEGNDIPLECRIIAVADAYDAMSSNRPYRDPLTFEDIILEFVKFSKSQFFPDAVLALFSVLKGKIGSDQKTLIDDAITSI